MEMTTGWNERITFKDHSERMREFRKSHAEVDLINGPRLDEVTSLERLHLLVARQMQPQTGGAVFYGDISGSEYMVPMWRVALYRLSTN